MKTTIIFFTFTFIVCACNKIDEISLSKNKLSLNRGHVIINDVEHSIKTRISFDGGFPINRIDLFAFNNDEKHRIDSYERIDPVLNKTITCTSTLGDKKIMFIANSKNDIYSWSNINCFDDLEHTVFDFIKEDASCPILVGMVNKAYGGLVGKAQPLLAKITLKTITCDFHKTPYADKKLEDIKIYLTNVCANTSAINHDKFICNSYINQRRLKDTDLKTMAHPELVFKDLHIDVDMRITKPNESLYCYPNIVVEGNNSSLYTRFVVEGKINGTTYYYPIELKEFIGNNKNLCGVEANMEYELNLTFTRLGSLDPDFPVEVGEVKLNIFAKPWVTKPARLIEF